MSNKILRTEMQKSIYQKITKSIQAYHYIKHNLQEIILVYNKSDAHKTICNSYNLELGSTLIKNIELENTSNNYT